MSFQFKQFMVEDDRSSMKVGTDAVLLGAVASHPDPENILDIGTGSGIIAMMMAQRFPKANILGIDVHRLSVDQARNNFSASPWGERLNAKNISLQDFSVNASTNYDLIVSNPPFFSASLLPRNNDKVIAKHTARLSYKDMAACVNKLIQPRGIFFLILPYRDHPLFEKEATDAGLIKTCELIIKPIPGKDPNRIISAWSQQAASAIAHQLMIRKDQNNYTDEYLRLTSEFYLAL